MNYPSHHGLAAPIESAPSRARRSVCVRVHLRGCALVRSEPAPSVRKRPALSFLASPGRPVDRQAGRHPALLVVDDEDHAVCERHREGARGRGGGESEKEREVEGKESRRARSSRTLPSW